MKPITRAFLAAELADLATTLTGLILPQVREVNPAGMCAGMIVAKAAVILFGVVILQHTRVRVAWVVPVIAAVPVAWNVVVIAAELAVNLKVEGLLSIVGL